MQNATAYGLKDETVPKVCLYVCVCVCACVVCVYGARVPA